VPAPARSRASTPRRTPSRSRRQPPRRARPRRPCPRPPRRAVRRRLDPREARPLRMSSVIVASSDRSRRVVRLRAGCGEDDGVEEKHPVSARRVPTKVLVAPAEQDVGMLQYSTCWPETKTRLGGMAVRMTSLTRRPRLPRGCGDRSGPPWRSSDADGRASPSARSAKCQLARGLRPMASTKRTTAPAVSAGAGSCAGTQGFTAP